MLSPSKGISYSHIIFRPDLGFISKTEHALHCKACSVLQPVVIKSLRPLVGKEKDSILVGVFHLHEEVEAY